MVRFYARLFTFFLMTSAMVIGRNCDCQEGLTNGLKPEPLDETGPIGSNPSEKPVKKRKKCCPYNFDGKMCRVVGNRVLCGYNRNVGKPSNDDTRELSNGCRLRGNRLECGYKDGPFTYEPRPPLWDSPNSKQDPGIVNIDQIPDRLLDVVTKATTTFYFRPTSCQNVQEKIICRRIVS